MDRITRDDRIEGRMVSVLVSVLLAAAALVIGMPASGAAENTCRARDVTQDTPWSSDLQAVIGAATRGDVIAVKFVCVGNFKIAKSLTLVGKPTTDLPYGVLNANGHGQVLVVSRAHLTLENLKITGGSDARWTKGAGITTAATLVLIDTIVKGNTGTGIYNTGHLTLEGASIVSQNSEAGIHQHGPNFSPSLTMNDTSSVTANSGYGIFSYYAYTTLNGASSVTRNITDVLTSLYNWEGTLTMNDSASVTDNVGTLAGGVYNAASFTMNGTSSVSGNTATVSSGGGVSNINTGQMTMNDSSSIVGNSTVRSGGGVANDGVLTMTGSSTITGNTSDADDNGVGGGGGIKVACSGTVNGAVDGGNVNDNYRGTAAPVENNIAEPPQTCG